MKIRTRPEKILGDIIFWDCSIPDWAK